MNEPDLITRLRGWPNLPGLNLDKDLMNEAAAEVERLNGRLEFVRQSWERELAAERELHAAEVERLRAQVDEALDAGRTMVEMAVEQTRENAAPAQQAEPAPWSKTVEAAALLLNRCTELNMDDCEGLAGTILGMAQQAAPSLTVGELPPLPDPEVKAESWTDEWGYERWDYAFSAEQMHAYARAALAPAAQAEPVAWVHAFNGHITRFFNTVEEARFELERLNREYPRDAHLRSMRPLVYGDAPASNPPAQGVDLKLPRWTAFRLVKHEVEELQSLLRAALAQAPATEPLTDEQQLEAFKAWAGREYRNAETYTARDLAHGFNAWRAARATA
jgi:hypothetical protein